MNTQAAVPDNLLSFNRAYRAAELEFFRTGVWKFEYDALAVEATANEGNERC